MTLVREFSLRMNGIQPCGTAALRFARSLWIAYNQRKEACRQRIFFRLCGNAIDETPLQRMPAATHEKRK